MTRNERMNVSIEPTIRQEIALMTERVMPSFEEVVCVICIPRSFRAKGILTHRDQKIQQLGQDILPQNIFAIPQ